MFKNAAIVFGAVVVGAYVGKKVNAAVGPKLPAATPGIVKDGSELGFQAVSTVVAYGIGRAIFGA